MSLKEQPIRIDDHNWYYEEADGVHFIHQVMNKDGDDLIRTDEVVIPWKRVLESVRRKYPEMFVK